MSVLEQQLRTKSAAGHKLLVPYLTGGYPGWSLAVHAAADAGADAIEIGIPFSDPVMDGPVIQQACQEALAAGTTTHGLINEIASLDTGIPTAVMTYYNLCYHMGEERFASELVAAGVAGAILADLPLVEADSWLRTGAQVGLDTILLAAPTTPAARLAQLCEASRGFVYAVGLLGVTGERAELARTATWIAGRCKEVTDKPVLCGVGIGSPAQAVEACEVADGVIIGSAVVRAMLEADDELRAARAVEKLVASYRSALDG